MKIKGKIISVIIKGLGAAIVWRLGCYVIIELRLPFLNTEILNIFIILGLLICGLILRSNSWLQTLISWLISVVFSSLVLLPQMCGFPKSFVDSGAAPLGFLLYVLILSIIMYIISTFISTLIIMLVYKFIQKKRKMKKSDKEE